MGLFDWLSRGSVESDTFTLPTNIDARIGLVASPDSTRLAYAVTNNKAYMEVNGKRYAKYDAISGITFSPDGRGFAYAGMHKNRWFVICNGLKYGPFDDIGKTSPVFSPDSKRIAYTVRRRNEWYVGVDGHEVGGPYEGFSPGGVIFSPDSKRILYVIKRGATWVAATDSHEDLPFPTIIQRSQIFSPDSKKIAYIAIVAGSNSGNAWAGEAAVVINGEVQQTWTHHDDRNQKDGISKEIYFSPDSKRMAYAVKQNDRWSFIVDGSSQMQSDGFLSGWGGNPQWTKFPDYGKTICRNEIFVFSPDSRHFAYAIKDKGRGLLIYDGNVKGDHPAILNLPPVFSPDSQRIAYGAEEGIKQLLIVDWKPQTLYDGLPAILPRFSSTSDHIAYIVTENNHFLLVVDSQTWVLDGGPVIGSKIVWDDVRKLHILIASGQKISVQMLEI